MECKIKHRLEVGGGGLIKKKKNLKDLPGRVATLQLSTRLPLQGAPTEAQRQIPWSIPPWTNVLLSICYSWLVLRGGGSRPDSWQDIKQRGPCFTFKKKKKEKPVGNSERLNAASARGISAGKWDRGRPKTDAACTLHLQSEWLTCQKELSSLRAILKAVNVLAMRKQKIYMEHSNMWRPDRAEMFFGSLTITGFSLGRLGMLHWGGERDV